MSEVVLGVHPTVHAAYQANKAGLGVSTTALYNKLDRVETRVSAALGPMWRWTKLWSAVARSRVDSVAEEVLDFTGSFGVTATDIR